MRIGIALAVVFAAVPALAQTKSKVEKPFVLVKGKPAKGAEPENEAKTAQELVDGGLAWLAKTQAADGRWTRSSKGKANDDKDVIPTAQAVLACVGAGHTHRWGKMKKSVARGVKWLKLAGKNGWGKKSDAPVLSEALRVQALGELYMISRDFTLKPHVEAGVKAMTEMASPKGGYGFKPKGPPNSLMTALVTLTYKTFKISGVPTPDAAFQGLRDYLVSCTGPDGLTGFSAPKQGISIGALPSKKKKRKKKKKYAKVPLFTAGAIIARIFCRDRRTDKVLRAGADLLSLPHPDRREPLYWYLGGYAMFQFGGKRWAAWQPSLLKTLTAKRKDDGSWGSSGVAGKLGGAAGTTALNVQTAEIVLRYERSRR